MLRALARRRGWELHCCGPGAAGVRRWAASARVPRGNRVVLVGVAGGLRPGLASGSAVEVTHVVPAEGNRPAPAPSIRLTALPSARCVAVTSALRTAEAKRAAAEAHRADVVDLESAAFALEAHERGWDWTILRGVSDAADESLPEGVERWTDARGRTRMARVAWAVLRGRVSGAELARLGSASARAMASVAAALEGVQAPRSRG